MANWKGQLGTFAGHTLHRVEDAPSSFVRYLASPQDAPSALRVLTHLDAAAARDVEQALAFRDLCALEARLRHDAIVPVTESGEWEGLPYIAREYRGGIDAEALIALRREGLEALPSALGATIALGIIEALTAAAGRGVHHLALDPSSVIVDPAGDVSLTGFAEGSYWARFHDASPATKWCAPELRRGLEVGPAADCYGFGALLFGLLTGREHPDEWEPRWTGMMMELSLGDVPGDALKPIVDFLHRALAERPSQRFADIHRLAAALRPVLVELDAPKPRQVVARSIFELLPKELLPNASFFAPGSLESGPAHVPVRVTRTSDVSALVDAQGDVASDPALAPEPRRDTRVLYNSQTSMRRLSPELREQIGPHPLEVLARSRYQVLGELGAGGTGTVYKVLDTTLNEILALKVLSSELTRDGGWLQRFKRELKITRDLEHPHILPAYHLEHLDGVYFFTMRYVDGETLYDRVKRDGALSLREGLPILAKVGQALQAAHARGIVHRDFKSANVMLERVTGVPFLMDFGIAFTAETAGLTITGQGIGTPMYMAPEQAMGKATGARADIYSFGVVLYEVFSGILPFVGTTTVAVYTAQINRDYRPFDQLAPSCPNALAELVDACLQPQEADRPASMEDVLACLRTMG